MHKSNVHQVKDGNLIGKLKAANPIKPDVDIDPRCEFWQERNGISKVAFQVGLVLVGGTTVIPNSIGFDQKVGHQRNQTFLMCGRRMVVVMLWMLWGVYALQGVTWS